MRRLVFLLAALLLIGAGGAYVWASSQWTGAGPAPRETLVRVAPGSSVRGAAGALEDAGVIASADRFVTLQRLFGDDEPVKAGEYLVPAGASPQAVLALLQSGRSFQRQIVVPEGTPSVLVHDRLMRESALTGSVAVPAEGSILPDSYSFEAGETRAAVVARMQAAMTRELDRLWRARKPTTAVRTKAEALTLASIVEKETGVPAERRTVAGVYSNRLRLGMPLQADPTVIYPITRGRPLGRRILRSELDARNGYNTYAMAGLPQGPIANPGRLSIAAVLDPAATRALYFVADGSGGHVFADTLQQHQANVERWYALRRSRGEM
ncbi:UPF0755 protein [Sphingomonas jejuensis]|uniref:Endolytic murein transglycosylase n=1 Tax=Sphingomonas jejuensis TaxID=904715 RepID=A0ABX0XL74_9SPHN|nr:endolytic transglycosylase MltG [Sphingomonas jejuensis]NJC33542.1 UPF0755 protein [Sphingomonas jejuensis]